MDDDDGVLARLAGTAVFLIVAAISLALAWLGATMEDYTSWSDPDVVSVWVFSAANVVAAAIAALRRSTWPARFAGFLCIVPAVVLLDADHGDFDWEITAGAAALVLLGGALAGGVFRPRGRRR